VAAPTLPPGCMSQGETREEALSMIREAIDVYIIASSPTPTPFPGRSRLEQVTVAAAELQTRSFMSNDRPPEHQVGPSICSIF
jgi:predicted RNase H-like HicB family nuclease